MPTVGAGNHHLPESDACYVTTFITRFGQNCFNVCIISAPELLQRRMSTMLQGMVCMMDDALIFGKNHKELDDHLEAVLKRLIALEVGLGNIPIF